MEDYIINDFYKNLGEFLLSINDSDDWKELVLNIEIQPGMLGLNGFVNVNDESISYLRVRPTEKLKNEVKQFHKVTCGDKGQNKWNKFKFILNHDLSFQGEFIWDESWQSEVDNYNFLEKKGNPNYNLPKWWWE